jgi:hypothetical protein
MAHNMSPDYEAKLLLRSEIVLDNDANPTNALQSAFKIIPTVSEIGVLFLDTDDKDIFNAGWSSRIRKTKGKDEFDLTYKKRYPVSGEDVEVALAAAATDGFVASSGNKYEAQVEWGYEKMTLSVSRSKKDPDGGLDSIGLLDFETARKMLIDEAPDKFNDFAADGWGKRLLQKSRIYGPVDTKRFTGVWQGVKLHVEVWPIRIAGGDKTELLVEVAFKQDGIEDARPMRSALIEMLRGNGWLCPKDSLKTHLIMANY